MMMFGDHSFVAFVDNDDIGAVFVRYFLKGPRYDLTKCNYFMWPPWLSVNITHCSVWSVFVVCDGDNYCLCVAVVVVVEWHHLDNEVSPLAALCDPVEAVGVVDGGVPGGKAAHLSSYYLAPLILSLVLLWNSHPSSILDQLHQRQWEEFPCKLLRRKLHFQGRFFLFCDPQFQLIHPTDILRCYIHPRWCFF